MLKIRDYLIAIFGIVALLVVGIIILIYYGTQSVFYLFSAIIIIGIIGWIYTISKKREKKNIAWLRNSKERVATEIKDLYISTEKNLNKILELNENINIDQEINELKYVKTNLASIGCYTQNYDIIYKALEKTNLSFLTQKKKDISDEIKRISNSVIEKLKFKISELYLNLKNILTDAENVGFNIQKFDIDTKINSIEEGINKINLLRKKESEIFDLIYKETLNLKTIVNKIQNIEDEISSIPKNFEGMKKLIKIREKLNEILKNKVNEVKETIYESQRKLSAVSLTEEKKNKFEEIVKGIENLNLKNIADIEKIENNYRNFLKELLEEQKQNLQYFSEEIEIPEWLKTKYGKTENEDLKINAPIDESLNIKDFANQVIEKIILAEKKRDNMSIPERIIKSSGIVFRIIDNIIEKKGFITPDDLSVNYKEDFLKLYVEKYPENANKIKGIKFKQKRQKKKRK